MRLAEKRAEKERRIYQSFDNSRYLETKVSLLLESLMREVIKS